MIDCECIESIPFSLNSEQMNHRIIETSTTPEHFNMIVRRIDSHSYNTVTTLTL